MRHAVSNEVRLIFSSCFQGYDGFLYRSNWRVKRLMSGDHGGLSDLVNAIAASDANDELCKMAVGAFYAGMDKSKLHLLGALGTTGSIRHDRLGFQTNRSIGFLEGLPSTPAHPSIIFPRQRHDVSFQVPYAIA